MTLRTGKAGPTQREDAVGHCGTDAVVYTLLLGHSEALFRHFSCGKGRGAEQSGRDAERSGPEARVPKLRGEHSRQATSLVGHAQRSDFLPLPPTRHPIGKQHKTREKTNTKDP